MHNVEAKDRPPRGSPHSGPPGRHCTLAIRLVLLINATAAAVLTLFWCVDFVRERSIHIQEAAEHLTEEAKILRVTRGILPNAAAFQSYLDSFCHQMDLHSSPGHHIVLATTNGAVLARAHVRDDAALEAAMIAAAKAAQPRFQFGGAEFAIARVRNADSTSIIVTQSLAPAYAIIHAQARSRATSLAVLGLIIGLLTTTVVWRWVRRPVRALMDCTESVRNGILSTRVELVGPAEMRLLACGFNTMASTLERHELVRLRELENAREIQRSLLPADSITIPGAIIAYQYRPAEHVGGDYLDVFSCGENQWVIALADVSGHGIAAAILATLLKTLIRHEIGVTADPGAVLTAINHELQFIAPTGHFVTCFIALYDANSGALRYANAGHEPGLLVNADGSSSRALSRTAPLLGVFPSMSFDCGEAVLQTGDRLILYTDGLVECQDSGNQFFGRQRLLDTIRHAKRLDPQGQIEGVVDAVRTFSGDQPLQDDVTIVALCRR